MPAKGKGNVRIYSRHKFHAAPGGILWENPEPQGIPVARQRRDAKSLKHLTHAG